VASSESFFSSSITSASRGISLSPFPSLEHERIGVFAGEFFVLAVKCGVPESLAHAPPTIAHNCLLLRLFERLF
jgi:hypothetical protein